MPELPEMENYKILLNQKIAGQNFLLSKLSKVIPPCNSLAGFFCLKKS